MLGARCPLRCRTGQAKEDTAIRDTGKRAALTTPLLLTTSLLLTKPVLLTKALVPTKGQVSYGTSLDAIERNAQTSRHYYTKAAELGNPEAQVT